MFKSQRAFKESERETRSAEEAMNFLNENFGPDECDRLAFMATMISITIYERQPNEELFWSAAFARHERRALNDETRRELQALLDEFETLGAVEVQGHRLPFVWHAARGQTPRSQSFRKTSSLN